MEPCYIKICVVKNSAIKALQCTFTISDAKHVSPSDSVVKIWSTLTRPYSKILQGKHHEVFFYYCYKILAMARPLQKILKMQNGWDLNSFWFHASVEFLTRHNWGVCLIIKVKYFVFLAPVEVKSHYNKLWYGILFCYTNWRQSPLINFLHVFTYIDVICEPIVFKK